jgi:hypothetical protein
VPTDDAGDVGAVADAELGEDPADGLREERALLLGELDAAFLDAGGDRDLAVVDEAVHRLVARDDPDVQRRRAVTGLAAAAVLAADAFDGGDDRAGGVVGVSAAICSLA